MATGWTGDLSKYYMRDGNKRIVLNNSWVNFCKVKKFK